jgi:hypothetical protein
MSSLSIRPIRHPIHWVSNYEINEADQPIAPIRGILRTLRSNQWLVLSRGFAKERTEFFRSESVSSLNGFQMLNPSPLPQKSSIFQNTEQQH